MKKIIALLGLLGSMTSFAVANVNYMNYATTNVTTSAYVTVVASAPINAGRIFVCDTSGHVLKMAVGAAGSEVDLVTTPYNQCIDTQLFPVLKVGSRISVKALDSTVSSGVITVSFLQ